MRTNLQVPFAEKDEAKRLGARWDAAAKVWYVTGVADLSVFARWAPGAAVAASATAAPRKNAAASAGITVVGSAYAEQPRVCACLPWDVCDKCRSTAIGAARQP